MIVVDSSCLLAILQNEPEKRAFEAALAGDDRYVMSAVNVHESLRHARTSWPRRDSAVLGIVHRRRR
jgi:uncharacterized protein with PIN domain